MTAASPVVRVSIVMPLLNEAGQVREVLEALQPLRARGHELILVDGGSRDDTATQSRPYADRILTTVPGRALQMNAGARVARGDLLLFLHADTRLPVETEGLLTGFDRQRRVWGRFSVRLSGARWPFRIIERMMNLRSCLTGIATGDQAIVVRRTAFLAVGGYPDQPLMEDIALSRRLKSLERPVCLKARVVTSSRRWERDGILRTVLLMWRLRLAYALGASPERLASVYYPGSTS